ncbi:MAG: DotU family type IV/VI secretion system protein [Planctomycetes bacterium]|jgi:type VI secretion system protein ImpK|nr:DotU family type IV/VI secretion system protein [Planctomycetota bacterium]
MRKEIADLVFPVFRKAIEIKEGLRANPRQYDFADSQKRLLALLQAAAPDHLRSDLLGDVRAYDQSVSSIRNVFLGIRYALACWLDEVFIADSPWKDQWNANKFETTVFGMNERASEFWKQAQRSQSRPTRDALEVYYLCVMLGFRGEMADNPGELANWRDNVEPLISQAEGRAYTAPPGLTVTPNVHALKGAAAMQKWFMIATVIGLLLIPLVIILVLR